MQNKTPRLHATALSVGLKINTQKTKIISLNEKNIEQPITLKGNKIDEVENFTYLGTNISQDNGTSKDLMARINKARTSFCRLRTVWKTTSISRSTKIKIYNSNVKSVLLYGAESWRVVRSDFNKLSSFNNTCLRKICKIFWPKTISNKDLYNLILQRDIRAEIKERRWKWIDYVLRKDKDDITKIALRWTPAEGKRKRGRPKETLRRTIESELRIIGMTWGEAEKKAQDR
ncbi:uncharacterized protein LOC134687734 [Mytilus trossulus]|uniref:uncharacterized protein LOC134687734 n=1 Tax=Mytilus trossulus TaxID=6551 RepID=UPI003004D1B9